MTRIFISESELQRLSGNAGDASAGVGAIAIDLVRTWAQNMTVRPELAAIQVRATHAGTRFPGLAVGFMGQSGKLALGWMQAVAADGSRFLFTSVKHGWHTFQGVAVKQGHDIVNALKAEGADEIKQLKKDPLKILHDPSGFVLEATSVGVGTYLGSQGYKNATFDHGGVKVTVNSDGSYLVKDEDLHLELSANTKTGAFHKEAFGLGAARTDDGTYSIIAKPGLGKGDFKVELGTEISYNPRTHTVSSYVSADVKFKHILEGGLETKRGVNLDTGQSTQSDGYSVGALGDKHSSRIDSSSDGGYTYTKTDALPGDAYTHTSTFSDDGSGHVTQEASQTVGHGNTHATFDHKVETKADGSSTTTENDSATRGNTTVERSDRVTTSGSGHDVTATKVDSIHHDADSVGSVTAERTDPDAVIKTATTHTHAEKGHVTTDKRESVEKTGRLK